MAFGASRRMMILVVLMLVVSMTGFATIARAQTPLESARVAVEDISAALEQITSRVIEAQDRADVATAAFWEQLNRADRARVEADLLQAESDELSNRIDELRGEVSELLVERYMGTDDDDGPPVFSGDLNAGVRADALASFASANRFDAMAEFEGLIENRNRVLANIQREEAAGRAASTSAAEARLTINAELASLASEQADLAMRLADLNFAIDRLEEEERQQVLAEQDRIRVEQARRAAEDAATAAAELARNQPLPTATPGPPTAIPATAIPPTAVPAPTAIPVIEPTVVAADAGDQGETTEVSNVASLGAVPTAATVPPTADSADIFEALDVDDAATRDEPATATDNSDPTEAPAAVDPAAEAQPSVVAPSVEEIVAAPEPTATPQPTSTPPPEPTPTPPPEPTATPEPVVTGTMAAGWTCPVQGPFTHIDDWGAPRVSGGWHKGNDMIADEGLPVVAVIGGTVEHRGNSVGGNSAHLKGDDGNYYYYTHLLGYENEGIGRVEVGTVIGYVGETGNAPIPHLHFEVHIGGYGNYTNPYPILREYC